MSLGLHIIFFGLAFLVVARLFQIIEKGRVCNGKLRAMMRDAYFSLKLIDREKLHGSASGSVERAKSYLMDGK